MKRLAIFLGLLCLGLGLLGASSAANLRLAGGLDPSFGSGGIVTQGHGSIGAIAVEPDGKIVVAVTTDDLQFQLTRYLPNGSLDSSFGDGGSVVTQVGGWARAAAVALQPDGKIVVAGGSYQESNSVPEILEEFSLARYNSNGSLDTSFGTDGIANTVVPEQFDPDGCFPASQAFATHLALTPGGDIQAAGVSEWSNACTSKGPDYSSLALVRYRPDGSLDSTFGSGGIAQAAPGSASVGIVVQPSGEVVTGDDTAVVRYAAGGSEDLGLDTAPKLDDIGALTDQKGKIVAAGTVRAKRSSGQFLVVDRDKTNGHLDPTFGTHGTVVIKRVAGLPTAVVAQSDGKLLIADGRAVVRLLPDGRLDTHFGQGGIVSSDDSIQALASLPGEKVLVGRDNANHVGWSLDRLLGGNNCVVPGLRGQTVSKARAELTGSFCRGGGVARRFSSKVARGRIISTAPSRGARLPGGTRVDLVVSKGR